MTRKVTSHTVSPSEPQQAVSTYLTAHRMRHKDNETMPSFLGLSAEVRCLIYHHVFQQPNNEILGVSREVEHNYDEGVPSDWIADSRQEGLVYGSNAPRTCPTNSRFLRTCRLINNEATPIFYGANKIVVYAEDNNDIFYWLLDIGERNILAIRHLEIGWAYGVSIESGRGNIHGILRNIEDMEDSQEQEILARRQQLIAVVQRIERRTTRLIVRTLHLLASNQSLAALAVYFPGVDGGDIWDLPNPGFYFAEELFSNSTLNVHACIPKALAKMIGIQSLTIGYTKDIELAEKIARATGANELIIRTCPEGHTLNLNKEEKARWLEHGWRLEGQTAHKTLMANIMEQQVGVEKVKTAKENECHKQRYLEGGRLKADMLFEDNTEENTKHGDAANMFSRRELMTRAWSEGQSEGNSKGTTQKSTDTSEENSYEMEGIQHSDSYEGEADNEESDQRS